MASAGTVHAGGFGATMAGVPTHENGRTVVANDETRRTFGEQLSEIKTDVIRFAAAAGELIGAGTQAILDADLTVVEDVAEKGRDLDEMSHSIEQRAYEMFATQQPMAVDLRTLLAILRILHELQLSKDLMVTVAKAARRLYPQQLPPKIRGIIERMGGQANVQLHLAIDAFADSDHALAVALPDMDDVMDDLQKELFRSIFSLCAPDEQGLQQAVQLALVGRYYERVADHAVLIGMWSNFMITGDLPSREPPETVDISG